MNSTERDLIAAIGEPEGLTENQRIFLRDLKRRPDGPLNDRDRAYLARIAGKAGVPVPEGFLALTAAKPVAKPGCFRTEGLEAHPLADLFPLMSAQEYEDLLASVRDHGFRASEPIVLFEGRILDGRNRYTAAWEADVEPGFRQFDPAAEGTPIDYVLDLNFNRRNLNESQRAMVAAGAARLGWGGNRRGQPSDQGANLRLDLSRREAADKFKVSERLIDTAAAVERTGIADLQDAVRQGRASVSAAAVIAELPQDEQKRVLAEIAAQPETKRAFTATVKELRRERQDEKRSARETREAELGARQMALPDKRYGVILADPEWRFQPRSTDTGMDRAADNHYPTSPTEEIAARPVASIAADDCALFLWATAPMLIDALAVLAAWGFSYKTHRVWHKIRNGAARGPGFWFTGEHELVLLGTRGNPPCPAQGDQWPSIFDAPVGAHSEKPDDIHELIEAYFPNLPKIELNARRARPGWDAWGNEAPFDPETGEIIEGDPLPSSPLQGEGESAAAPERNNPPSEGGGGVVEPPSAATDSNAGSRGGTDGADPVPEDALRSVRPISAAGGEAALDAAPPPADGLTIPKELWRAPEPWPGEAA